MIMSITILYGSQTGNAEDMAKRIGQQAKSLGYQVLVEAADDFVLKDLPKQRFLLFVCSTTGHGQEPENMKNFYNFMRRRDLPKDCLSNLNYTVYGLGDSSYAKFNYVSKILFKRLQNCGANPIQELVAGDEQHPLGCDGIIYPKLDELWLKLGDIFKTSALILDGRKTSLPPSSYEVIMLSNDSTDSIGHVFKKDFAERYNLKTAICTANDRVTSKSHFQDTRLVCFNTEEPLDYEPGDVCSILPANSDDNVDQFIETLSLDPKQRFALRKRDTNYMVNYLYDFVPDGLSIRDLVKYYLDIQSVPKRSFFQFLWPFSKDELEGDKLKEFASTEGQEEMYEYCIQPKRSILEVLLDFPNTVSNVKFEYLMDLVPPIKPRSFSIASCSSLHPKEVQLIVGVVKYQTRLRKTRKGLCSNYLAAIKPVGKHHGDAKDENRLRFFVKRSDFKLPEDDNVPVILVGPGLGIAPFRSFIESRSLKANNRCTTYLYFGCRYKIADYYFREELEQYHREGSIRMKVAFSREVPKRYVQDLLAEDSDLIRRLIVEENAIFYVAGNSKLPEELRTLLAKILVDDENGDSDQELVDGQKRVADLEAQGRILYDCW